MPKSFEEQVAWRLSDLGRRVRRLELPSPNWLDWTPTLTQSGSVAATVTYARYVLAGDLVIAVARLAVTGSGSAGNSIIIGGQPSVIQHGNDHSSTSVIGTATVFNNGTAYYVGVLVSQGSQDWRVVGHGQTNFVGIDPSFALANGDAVGFTASFER